MEHRAPVIKKGPCRQTARLQRRMRQLHGSDRRPHPGQRPARLVLRGPGGTPSCVVLPIRSLVRMILTAAEARGSIPALRKGSWKELNTPEDANDCLAALRVPWATCIQPHGVSTHCKGNPCQSEHATWQTVTEDSLHGLEPQTHWYRATQRLLSNMPGRLLARLAAQAG